MQCISSLCRTCSMWPHGRPVEWLQSLRCSQESQGKVETDHKISSVNAMSEATLSTADPGPQIILTLFLLPALQHFGLLLCWRKGGREEGKEKGRHVLRGTEWHFQLTAAPAEESRLVGKPWIADTIVFMHWGGLASENKVQKCIWVTGQSNFNHCGQFWPLLLFCTRTVKALCYPRGKIFLETWTREFLQDQT